MKRLSPQAGQAGFTLVELLVVLTLLGLIWVAIFGGLRFGARVWEVGAERSEHLNEPQVVQALLRRQITQAFRLVQRAEDVDQPAAFLGEEARLRFIAPAPAHAVLGGLYAYDLMTERGDRGDRLVLRWRLFRPEVTLAFDEDDAERRILLEGAETVSFSYYGVRQGEDESRWDAVWAEGLALPELVSVSVGFAETDRRRWPVLLVAPKAR